MLLNHLQMPNAIQPLSNLQDLHLWLVRVGIPNTVIDNCRFLLHFYVQNPTTSRATPLRYDDQAPIQTYIPLAKVTQTSSPDAVSNHSVFRDYPTPDGSRFIQWLQTSIHVPAIARCPCRCGTSRHSWTDSCSRTRLNSGRSSLVRCWSGQ